jgi:hypothetical protein
VRLRDNEYEDREHSELMIVPPLWQKRFTEFPYSEIWPEARRVLGAAKAIFVIGYSLPLTDVYTQAALRIDVAHLDFLCVVSPDPDARARVMEALRSAVEPYTHVVHFDRLADLASLLPKPNTEQADGALRLPGMDAEPAV